MADHTPHESALVYGPQYLNYDFGPDHPLQPIRLRLTHELLRYLHVLDLPGVSVLPPRVADDSEILLIHTQAYMDKVKDLSLPGSKFRLWGAPHGLGTMDNPVFEGMHDASACTVGGSLVAAEAVVGGKVKHAFNIAGGLHHAHPNYASGFCIYNDAAVAIEWMTRELGYRVMYVDIDAHHGDGVQAAFYDRKDVLTVSLHETGEQLFPGTGDYRDIGEGEGYGFAVNIPFEPLTYDEVYTETFRAVVPPLARLYRPDIILTQLGCDSHWSDPLAHLVLTMQGFQTLYGDLHSLAHEVCDGRWVAVGGGGYQVFSTVPKAWTIAFAEQCSAALPDEVPQAWVSLSQTYDTEPISSSLWDRHTPNVIAERRVPIKRAARAAVEFITETVFPILAEECGGSVEGTQAGEDGARL